MYIKLNFINFAFIFNKKDLQIKALYMENTMYYFYGKKNKIQCIVYWFGGSFDKQYEKLWFILTTKKKKVYINGKTFMQDGWIIKEIWKG